MLPNNSMERLCAVMEQNGLVTYLLSRYLNEMPRLLTADEVEGFAKKCELDRDIAFRALFSAACGLDAADNREHRQIERLYFNTGLHALDTKTYTENPYWQTIHIKEQKRGRWELCEHHYEPYEPFVCGHPVVTPEFREIPQIGYFTERFSFPAVLENGVEWMTVTPNEIETMKDPIEAAHGKVLTLGLGLGYYAFMVSEKETVETVTVVEKDRDVIALFEEIILPQFPHKEKVRILEADAFAYMKSTAPTEQFDYVFADLWHDQSDGLEMYLRLRRLEETNSKTVYSYWIEPTILTSLRHMVFDKLTEKNTTLRLSGVSSEELLTDDYLKRLAPSLKRIE